MITKTYHDIYDLVELVSMLADGQIEISMDNGSMYVAVINFVRDDITSACRGEYLSYKGDDHWSGHFRAYHENIDLAYRLLEEKIASGEWRNADDCA